MKFQEIINLLDTTSDDKDLLKNKSKFMINKKKNYSINKEIRIKTPMPRSDLCDLIVLSIKQFYCIKIEFQKIINLPETTSHDKDLPRFVTKKWIEVYDQSEKNYSVNKEIRIKTSMLRSDLCDFSDAYIVVKGRIMQKEIKQ